MQIKRFVLIMLLAITLTVQTVSAEEIMTVETENIAETEEQDDVEVVENLVDCLDTSSDEAPSSDDVEEQDISGKDIYELKYRVHVQDYGWQDWVSDGELSGTTGESKRLEAIELKVVNSAGELIENLQIEYRVHVQDYGWQDWVSNGELSGTTGKSKRLEAIQIRLKGTEAINYKVEYQAHAQDFGWLGNVSTGELSGTSGFSKRLESMKIVLKNVEEESAFTERGYLREFNNQELSFSGHVQNLGDVKGVANGAVLGTSGKSLRIEGITICLDNSSLEVAQGNIEYSTHVQDYGWLDTVSNGEYSGTKGESKRVEAIKIQLTGEISRYYDIYYRTHVQEFGWLGWAKNGQEAGTAGYAYRMEAVQIKLVVKGDAVPSTNNVCFRDKSDIDGLIEMVKSYVGCTYRYGGTTPSGWDCSGCTQWIYKNIFGISIPRSSREQSRVGREITKIDMNAWQPGDLIFWGNGSVSHVSIYIGNGNMLHALNEKRDTVIDSVVWYEKADKKTSLMFVKRIL